MPEHGMLIFVLRAIAEGAADHRLAEFAFVEYEAARKERQEMEARSMEAMMNAARGQ